MVVPTSGQNPTGETFLPFHFLPPVLFALSQFRGLAYLIAWNRSGVHVTIAMNIRIPAGLVCYTTVLSVVTPPPRSSPLVGRSVA